MSPLMHFQLNDGRSIIAASAFAIGDETDRLLAAASQLVFVAEQHQETYAFADVRRCALLRPGDPVPAASRIFAFAALA